MRDLFYTDMMYIVLASKRRHQILALDILYYKIKAALTIVIKYPILAG